MGVKKLIFVMISCMGMTLLTTGCATNYQRYSFGSASNVNSGVNYLLGRGVEQIDEKAFYYFDKAAESGDAYAQNAVAYMYVMGKGTPRNAEKAFNYYQKAANQGLASAQYSLGALYMRGLGVERNRAKGLEWFKRSADAGFEPAKTTMKRYKA